jgi:accessory gene regulator B
LSRFTEKAVSHLVSAGSVPEGNRDIYEYGFYLMASLAVNLLISTVIGFVFGMPLAMLSMFLSLSALRTVSGGYHAASFGRCAAVSAASITAAIAAIRFTPEFARIFVAAVLSALTLLVVFVYAPVGHPNRPLSTSEIVKFRKVSRVAVIIAVIISLVLFLMRASLYGFSIAVGIALSGTATLLAALKNQGVEHNGGKV